MLPPTLRVLHIACVYVLAGLFAFAGVAKLGDVQGFAMTISDFGFVPPFLERTVAWVLPILELASAIALVVRVRFALTAIVLQLLLFVGVLGYGIALGLDVDCGCFGLGEKHGFLGTSLESALTRDLILLGLCAYVFLYRRVLAPRFLGEAATTRPDALPSS